MKNGITYDVLNPNGGHPIGYFLNNFYYSYRNDWVEGDVDSEGNFFSRVLREGFDNSQPAGKVDGEVLTRYDGNLRLIIREKTD